MDKNYNNLIGNIGILLEESRKQAVKSINTLLIKTYWGIGRNIIKYEQGGKEKALHGSKLLDNLSKDLSKRYGKGFSIDNLERMRKFYLMFPNSAAVSRKLSWWHYCLIMRIKNPNARGFYLIETEKENWSTRELERQINSLLYERLALSRDKKKVKELSLKGQVIEKPSDLIKEPYILEFLNLERSYNYSETELEQKLIDNLKKFILELGKGFMFVERQQRITLEDENFYIDLVFYNRILKCFVILELKIGRLTHKDLGQLQMYVNYYDRKMKNPDENPTIGILLCTDKKETIVKYTLPENNNQIFASEYKIYLPTKKELEQKLKELLS